MLMEMFANVSQKETNGEPLRVFISMDRLWSFALNSDGPFKY